MNSILQKQMDAYALMKARQGIAREMWMGVHTYQYHVRQEGRMGAHSIFCRSQVHKLMELSAHQFSHRPTIPPSEQEWTEEERRDAELYRKYERY